MDDLSMHAQVSENPQVQEQGGDMEDFGALLEKSLKQLKEGELVQGTVVKVTDREVYIDVGAKSEGIVPRAEFKDKEVKPGDVVTVYIESVEGRGGRTLISKHKADFTLAWDQIQDAYLNDKTVKARVLHQVKGGLMVEVFGVNAFLPGSQLDNRRVRNFAKFVGKDIEVKIIKVNRARKNIVVSRREVLEEELEKARERLKALRPGEVLKGVIKNITDFGAFVDLGFVDGLIHLSDLSWHRIDHPSRVVKIGQEVDVKVLSVDPEKMRVSLSLKHLQPHPWESVAQKYPIGSTVTGVVKKILDFGAIVELEPGIEGFVHINEMRWGRPPRHPSEVMKEGDRVDLVVLNVDIEKQRISLGYKQAQPDPWALIDEKFPVGSVVRGTVKELSNTGAYLDFGDGIEGFLHVGDISWTQRFSHPEEALKVGQKLRVVVMRVDKKERILEVSLKHTRPNPWEQIQKNLPEGTVVELPITEVGERGIVVQVEEGLEGFVPRSHLIHRNDPQAHYQVGQTLTLQVLKVEPERKRVLLSEREIERRRRMEERRAREAERAEMKEHLELKPVRLNLGDLLRSELEKLEALRQGLDEEGEEEPTPAPQEEPSASGETPTENA